MSTRAGLGIIAVLLIAIGGGSLLSGCAAQSLDDLPVCPPLIGMPGVDANGEYVLVLDQDDLARLKEVLDGMRGHTCRFVFPWERIS